MTKRCSQVLLPVAMTVTMMLGPFVVPIHAEEFSYDDWARVLTDYVDDEGLVDYGGLAADRAPLDRFLHQIETMGPDTTPDVFPTRDHQLAYYINAYNAQVFAGVLALPPDADTVWGITGTGFGFFLRMKVNVDGETMSLNKLEDDFIRKGFQDPRIHAALNCASRGCPKLPREPFVPGRLDDQLDAEMRRFINEERNCSLEPDSKTATLSKIFDWFRKDFEQYETANGGGDLRSYLNRYRAPDAQIPADYDLDFAPYDKRLNRQ